jgi:hypothetical protein
MLQGLRKAFLQNHPLQSNNEINPNTTSNAAPLPENEIPLIINDLNPKTPENNLSVAVAFSEGYGNKPATPIDPLFAGYPLPALPQTLLYPTLTSMAKCSSPSTPMVASVTTTAAADPPSPSPKEAPPSSSAGSFTSKLSVAVAFSAKATKKPISSHSF